MRPLAVLMLGAVVAQAGFDEARARALAAHQAQRLDEAVAAYEEAVAENPQWAEGWWSLGSIHYGLDRYAEGRDAFLKLVELSPEVGIGWAFLGLCQYQTQESEKALASLQKARRYGVPAQTGVLEVAQYHLGALLVADGQFEQALPILESLATKAPANDALRAALGQALLRHAYLPGDLPAEFTDAVQAAGEAGFWIGAGNVAKGRAAWEAAVEQHGDAPGVRYAYGSFLLASDSDRALEELEKELDRDPEHVAALLQISLERLKRAEPDRALPYAKRAAETEPENFAARHAYGSALLGTGETEAAVAELETAVRLAPDSPQTRFALARAYRKAGRAADAEREQSEFLRLQELQRLQETR